MTTNQPDFTPQDADRIRRWEDAGQPAVPLLVDDAGQVQATSINVRTMLRRQNPAMALFHDTAADWIDAHCHTDAMPPVAGAADGEHQDGPNSRSRAGERPPA